jgi:hypothetical protein
VQRLDTDQVLDRRSGELLPVRSPNLDALFPASMKPMPQPAFG